MGPAALIDNLALSVIAGAYILLFFIQLMLWNRMEKMITTMSLLNITVAGALPEVRTRMKAIEDQQNDIKVDIRELQFRHAKMRDL